MKKWKKEEALNSLKDLTNQINALRHKGRKSQEHTRWLANSLRTLEEIFGHKSRYYQTLSHFEWGETGQMLIRGFDIEYQIEQRHNMAYQNQLSQVEGLLLAAQDQLNVSEVSEVYEDDTNVGETTRLITILNLGEKKLRKVIREMPTKEKEVQDKFEDLLLGNDIDYIKEFPHIKYSSKQYIPDFCVEKLNLAIEIKLCKTDEKALIAQLNDDILAYKTKFQNILFVIYDLSQIRDVDNFKSAFDSYDGVIIQVIKH